MKITKNLLIHYSNRFLEGELSTLISNCFDEAFRNFRQLKKLAAGIGYQIRLINRESFLEDDVLCFHYLSFDGARHDLGLEAKERVTPDTVLEFFLKPALKALRNDPLRLAAFIKDYVYDLALFFRGLLELVEATRSNRELHLLLVVQDMAAPLYPLLVRLYNQQKLTVHAPTHLDCTLLQLVELVDLRICKLQGTDCQVEIANLMREFGWLSPLQIAERLSCFCQRFMTGISICLQ